MSRETLAVHTERTLKLRRARTHSKWERTPVRTLCTCTPNYYPQEPACTGSTLGSAISAGYNYSVPGKTQP